MIQKLTLKRGEDPTFSCTLTDDETDAVVDLTGYIVRGEIWFDDEAQLHLTAANGGVVLSDPPSGTFSIALTEVQTETLPLGRIAFLKVFIISPEAETAIAGPIYLELPI